MRLLFEHDDLTYGDKSPAIYHLSRLTNVEMQTKLKIQLFDYTKRWRHHEHTI